MKISVVIPVYNGARTIGRLAEELFRLLTRDELEVILVNDGSADNSHDICVALYQQFQPRLRYLCLSKNFGEHNAVMAALHRVTGDYAVIVDDDFQNPPDEIQRLVDTAVAGDYDVVYSYYREKRHSWLRNAGSHFNNLVATWLLGKPRALYLSSFKCMNRFIIGEVVKYGGPYPYVDGLILRTTRRIGTVLVKHAPRAAGKSGYTLRKLMSLWLNMFVNFSVNPLRVSTLLGFAFSTVGALCTIYIILERMLHPEIPQGYASLIVGILVAAGTQMVILGVIGEYLGKLFLSENQTPQYVVRHAFPEQSEARRS